MNTDYENKIVTFLGETGKKWLDELPQIIKKYEQKWSIRTFPPFPLSYNYVCPAETFDKKSVVLKISFPNNTEFATEIEALQSFNHAVSIRILEIDLESSAVLLERATPGTRLREVVSQSEQVHIASQVIGSLHKPVTTHSLALFPSISDWAQVFDRYTTKYSLETGPIPKKIFSLGESIFKEFMQDKKEHVVLHGDLHSDNILLSERGWLVIDPKGVIGEREFELGAYLRNPYYDLPEDSDHKKIEADRISQFSEELDFDRERIRGWALACAVVSLLWFLEDESTFKDIYVRNAELLHDIKF